MKYSLQHNIDPSVYLWLDNLLILKNQAFGTYSGSFRYSEQILSGYYSYSAPHRQFVYDASVPASTVPTGFYSNSVLLPSNVPPNNVDFYRGQVLMTSPSNTVTAAYSYKEVNVYFSTKTDNEVLFENKFVLNPRSMPRNENYSSKDLVYPCIFIKSSAGKNETLAFDGCSATRIPLRMTILTDSLHMYHAITSALRDQAENFIPIFNPSEMPFNVFYNLTGVNFNYLTTARNIQEDSNRLAFIKSVNISDFQDRVNNLIGPQVFGGFADLELELVRFPRS